MTEHEPLKIIILCRSWREIDSLLYEIASRHPLITINFPRRRVMTKNKDNILFYTKDSKTMDGVNGDVLVTDLGISNLDRQIVRYSRLEADKTIWSYADLVDYLGGSK